MFEARKFGSRRPQDSPRGPEMGPRGPKVAQTWPEGPRLEAPRWSQDGPTMAPRFPKRPRDGTKKPLGGPNMTPRTAFGSSWASWAAQNRVQDVPKSVFEAIEMAKCLFVNTCFSPRRGASFSHAKRCQHRPRGPKKATRKPQDGPKRIQNGPKTVPK